MLELCLQYCIFPFPLFLKNNLFSNIFVGTFYKLSVVIPTLSLLASSCVNIMFCHCVRLRNKSFWYLLVGIFNFVLPCWHCYSINQVKPSGLSWLLSFFLLHPKSCNFLWVLRTHHFKSWALLFFLLSQFIAALYFLPVLC